MTPARLPLCECGHPDLVHHGTQAGNVTYCTVWSAKDHDWTRPHRCPCKRYVEAT